MTEVALEKVDQISREYDRRHIPITLEALTAQAVNWIRVRVASVEPWPDGTFGDQCVGVAGDDFT